MHSKKMSKTKLALVTGASSGLGKVLCEALAAQQVEIILIARDVKQLQKVALELPTLTQVYALDLSLPKERKKLIRLIHLIQPDLVINNAGFGLYGQVLAHPLDKMDAMIEVNVQALMEISIETARALIQNNKQGTIVNISSAAGFFSYPTFCVYAATKAFVNCFSVGLDAELKTQGVRVLTACPGQIDTEFRRKASGNYPQKKSPFTMSPQTAAKLILKQIEKGKALMIMDWRYRCLIALTKLLPQWLLHCILKRSLKKRHAFNTVSGNGIRKFNKD